MTMPSTRRLVVVSAGLSQPSSSRLLADRLAEATEASLADSEVATDTTVVELRDHAYDITTQLLKGFATDELDGVIQTLGSADGAIVVTPIFTTSYSGLFKSFLDILDPKALAGLPVLLAATGGSQRHSLALDYAIRPLFTYLHALPMSTTVYAATSDWGASADSHSDDLPRRIDRAGAELAREILLRDPARSTRAVDPLALPPGFDPSGAASHAGVRL